MPLVPRFLGSFLPRSAEPALAMAADSDIAVDADRKAMIKMTLTSPACPSAQQIPSEVRYKVKAVPGVSDATVEIVWEPPWDKDRMSEAAKLQLGFF